MKKHSFFAILGLGLLALIGFSAKPVYNVAYAEPGEGEDPVPAEVFECSVIVSETKHGTIEVDKLEGHVGDIVTITAKHDILYIINFVSVNGTNLVEDEETEGLFTFALVEGENKIEAKFVIDQELLGEMSIIMDQALNKDWTHLFSVENVIRIISFLLSGGILIAIARYFIKDKRLEKKVEEKIQEVIEKIIPEATKQTVLATIEEFITPIFAELKLDSEEMKNALTVFSRCLALSQENTPEAKIAITRELGSLKLSDDETTARVQKAIAEMMVKQNEQISAILKKIEKMEDSNKIIVASEEVVAEVAPEPEPEPETEIVGDDGTQI